MADAVRGQIEQQIPELHDLVASGIFDEAEVKRIVSKRLKFEYALRRRRTRKKDFISYLEYELNCEKLRLHRKEKRKIMKKKSAPSELGGQKRVLFIFQRAVQKFKGDLRLWNDYFDFCERTGSHKVLGRAFAEALRFNPLSAELWVRAAAWEFNGNNNIKAARILLQRGLRLAPDSKKLWTEYLRLELLYLNKIHQRRALLGLPISASSRASGTSMEVDDSKEHAEDVSDDDDEDSDEDSDEEASESRLSRGVKLGTLAEEENVVKESDQGKAAVAASGMDRFLEGDVVREVYKAAVAQFPDDVDFQVSLIDVIRIFSRMRHLVNEAYANLGDSAVAVAARCVRPARDFEAVDGASGAAGAAVAAVVSNFSSALEEADGLFRMELGEMFAEFVVAAVENLSQPDIGKALPVDAIEELCRRVHVDETAGSQLYALWCRVATVTPSLLHSARAEVYEAATRALAVRGLSGDAADAAMMWAAEVASENAEAADEVYFVATELIEDDTERVRLLEHRVDFCIGRRDNAAVNTAFDAAVQAATAAAWAHRANPEHEGALCTLIVRRIQWTWARSGVGAARKVYNDFLRSTPIQPGWAFLESVIDFEAMQPELDLARIRGLLEKAVTESGEDDHGPWLRFLELEASVGEVGRLGQLYDRALRSLRNPVPFISAARLRQIEHAS